MKRWKCPVCGNLTEYKIGSIIGVCTIDVQGNATIEEWEQSDSYCEECGFEERPFENEKFEIVEV